jgi:hypothetical protein
MPWSTRGLAGRLRRASAVVLVVGLSSLATPAARGQTAAQGQFVLRCLYSHTLMDDPIVYPGRPGASHSHDFFGNVTANAHSTIETMLAGATTCRVPSDTAGYWAPTAYLNSVPIQPTVMRIYYLGPTQGRAEIIPAGIQMIGGNKNATTATQNPHVRWSCGETRDVKTPRSRDPYDCTPWAEQYSFVDGLIAVVDFPSCWTGRTLGPESVAYPDSQGQCSPTFPHVLPKLSERIHYGIMNPLNPDGTVALTLSSGPYWTYHADFWNTWQQARLDQLVEDCIVARVHCGAVDAATSVDWTEQFGTPRYDLAYATATVGDDVYVAGFTNFALPEQRYHHRYDAFVRKYDADGNELWTRQFGSTGTDQVLGIAADETGVVVVGSTDGRLPRQEAAGGVDAFAARFGPSGRELWVRQFGSRADDRAMGVALGPGGAYLTGATGGALGERQGGVSDAFVARLDDEGEIGWFRQFGTGGTDQATAVAARAGRLYVVGSTTAALRGPYLGGASDGFAAAFDTGGRPVWRQPIGTSGADLVTGLVARANGLFISGSTDGILPEQTAVGGLDAFVGKLDPTGIVGWFRQFGTTTEDEAVAIGADAKGIYVAGSTTAALPDGEPLGEWDGFVRKYLPNGTQLWTRQLGTTDYDRAYGLSVERTGLYVVGTTHGAFEGHVNVGDRDVFVVRVAFS